jgi:hypothetical protein
MNPKKLWLDRQPRPRARKVPLPQFIEHLYLKRFGRERPEVVVSIEQRAPQIEQKKADLEAVKAARRAPETPLPERDRGERWPPSPRQTPFERHPPWGSEKRSRVRSRAGCRGRAAAL